MMFALASAGLTAFVLCLLATPLIRNTFAQAKLLDHPDERRKLHRQAMPRVGGIAIMLSLIGALAFTPILAPHNTFFLMRYGALSLFLLPATALVFITGLVDDLKGLKPWQKLFGQSLAAAIAVSHGGRISLHDCPGWLSCGISFVWLLVCTNAFNLIDGVDGLATGVAFVAAMATLSFAIIAGNTVLALAAAALAGCLLAFLRYNFPPASIFLGDCGSLTIGFILGCFTLNLHQSSNNTSGVIAPLMMLSIPLLDVVLALGRRFLRSKPLFQGDRHHIHHKLLARALTTRSAVLILYGMSGLTALLSLLFSYSQPRLKWPVFSLFCALAITGITSLRYVEFSIALRSVFRRSMRRRIKEDIYLEELVLALSNAITIEAIWDVICIACEDLQIETLRMTLCDRNFCITTGLDEETLCWAITVPLGQQGELRLTRSSTAGQPGLMVAVLERLQLSISRRDFSSEDNRAEEPVFSHQEAA